MEAHRERERERERERKKVNEHFGRRKGIGGQEEEFYACVTIGEIGQRERERE